MSGGVVVGGGEGGGGGGRPRSHQLPLIVDVELWGGGKKMGEKEGMGGGREEGVEGKKGWEGRGGGREKRVGVKRGRRRKVGGGEEGMRKGEERA